MTIHTVRSCLGALCIVLAGMTHAQRVETLEQKLRHLRSWMAQLQRMMEGSNQMAVQNSRRLFVGGLPADITQVCLIHQQ